MARKKTTKIKDDETMYKLAIGWQRFVELISDKWNMSDHVFADLAFESTLSPTKHYMYAADEKMYLNDIRCVEGKVRFVTPYGTSTKSFGYEESDIVLIDTGGERESLYDVIGECFTEAFKDTKLKTINDLEDAYLKSDNVSEVLNDAYIYIRQHELKNERKKRYHAVEKFGMF